MIQDRREKNQKYFSDDIFHVYLCFVSHPSIVLMPPLSADPTNVSFDERRLASGSRESSCQNLVCIYFPRQINIRKLVN